ncbi:MAG: DUF58 domain-containing protein [Actinomycetota bacterium]
MPGRRTVVILLAGLGFWTLARLLGSPTVHAVAVALLLLPPTAALLARRVAPRVVASRRLAEPRAAAGQRVEVRVRLANRGQRVAPLLLVEDAAPEALGGATRLVVSGLGPGDEREVGYVVTPTARGRYALGPLRIEVADPFGIAPVRLEFPDRDELVVTPPLEDLLGAPASPFGAASGLALSRRLFRGAGDFSLMREYREGDDLRRIHWPSVARRGELMIRQDESSSRARAVLYLDARAQVSGREGDPRFEHLVGVAASLGSFFPRAGFATRFATGILPPAPASDDAILDALAGVAADGAPLTSGLARLRGVATADTVLAFVAGLPDAADLAALARAGSLFGPKLAALVPPDDRPDPRADAAMRTLSRAGWRVLLVPPGASLRDRWIDQGTAQRAGSSS